MYYIAPEDADFFRESPIGKIFANEEEAQKFGDDNYLGLDSEGRESRWTIEPINPDLQQPWANYSFRQAYETYDRYLCEHQLGEYAEDEQ